MKNISKANFLLATIILFFVSCNNAESSKKVSEDSIDNNFNPAGLQKKTSTYDPRVTDTDTMYKNVDSIDK